MHRPQVKAAAAEQIPCRTCGGRHRKEKIGKSETVSLEYLILKDEVLFITFSITKCTKYTDIGVVNGLIGLLNSKQ